MLKQAFDAPLPSIEVKPENPTIVAQKKALRHQIRKLRKTLTARQQKLASRNLLKQLHQSRLLLSHTHIALYLGNDGELNPEQLIPLLWAKKKKLYLPVIHPLAKHQLCFCAFTKKTALRQNRFGIKEPDFRRTKRMSRQFLSLVMLPLVAFDSNGNRMGMGGGFYDRSFAYKHKRTMSKPKLIGLAHNFQKQTSLPTEEWDVPLDGILTDTDFYKF